MKLTAAALFLALPSMVWAADGPLTQWSGNSHFYQVIQAPETGISWEDAEADAVARKGHLASITSEEENTFVFTLVAADVENYWFLRATGANWGPWIGGQRLESTDVFTWTDGETFSYTNWGGNNPDGDNFTGAHINFWTANNLQDPEAVTDTWNDARNVPPGAIKVLAYVVEWETDPSTAAPSVAPTAAPTAAPTPEPPSFICFSAESTAKVKDQGETRMDQLQIGDYVKTGSGQQFSKVHSFGHLEPSVKGEYLQIETTTTNGSTNKPIELSSVHMIYANSKIVPSRDVKVGDVLIGEEGEVVVSAIRKVTRRGAYSPITTSGNIMVNDSKASNYALSEWVPKVVPGAFAHFVQHGFTTGQYVVCSLISCPKETYSKDGFPPLAQTFHSLELWQLDLDIVPRSLLFLLTAPLFLVAAMIGFAATSWANMATLLATIFGFCLVTKTLVSNKAEPGVVGINKVKA